MTLNLEVSLEKVTWKLLFKFCRLKRVILQFYNIIRIFFCSFLRVSSKQSDVYWYGLKTFITCFANNLLPKIAQWPFWLKLVCCNIKEGPAPFRWKSIILVSGLLFCFYLVYFISFFFIPEFNRTLNVKFFVNSNFINKSEVKCIPEVSVLPSRGEVSSPEVVRKPNEIWHHVLLQLTVGVVSVSWSKLLPYNVVFTGVLINHIPEGHFSSSLLVPQCSEGRQNI